MNTILLQPTDILFFRDGRPMTGALAGHGAAWPSPNVINAAFHSALHRAQLDSGGLHKLHAHRRGGRGVYASDAQRDRLFGSLVTAGPFPVQHSQTWFFPRPGDLMDATLSPALLPTAAFDPIHSSLPDPLEYAVANRLPPGKETGAKAWLSRAAFQRYLEHTGGELKDGDACNDADFFDAEHTIGIGIDRSTETTGKGEAEGKIYSAHYLRLRDSWQMGVCALAEDKDYHHSQHGCDLVKALLNGGSHQIIIGGQQRVSTARLAPQPGIPLPRGKTNGFLQKDDKHLVKWVLLSHSVWPEIAADPSRSISPHPGGWLPNWINGGTGDVLLTSGPGVRKAQRKGLSHGQAISARLVAALIPKPIVVTGWALPDEASGESGGARNTHLAVPAGAVYYFEADSADEARKLAAALNWHGADSNPVTIKNRRSTLLGEKGFGLGVCGTWNFFDDVQGRPHP